MEEKNQVALFEEKHLTEFKKLSDLKKEQDRLATIEKDVKSQLEKAMDENNIVSIKNEYITISRVEGSESTSIDLKKLEEKEPDLYKDLLKDYPKVTVKKPSIRFTVK